MALSFMDVPKAIEEFDGVTEMERRDELMIPPTPGVVLPPQEKR